MTIDEILKERKVGLLSNKITLHAHRLGIRIDPDGIYDRAKAVVNDNKKWKDLIKKLKEYED